MTRLSFCTFAALRLRNYISYVLLFIIALFTITGYHAGTYNAKTIYSSKSKTYSTVSTVEKKNWHAVKDIERNSSQDVCSVQFQFPSVSARVRDVFQPFLLSAYLSFLDNKVSVIYKAVFAAQQINCIPIFRLLIYPKHWFW
jgi:hypothetical protein